MQRNLILKTESICKNQAISRLTGILRTYFKTEETPLCRFEQGKITTSRGDGIPPDSAQKSDTIRRVGNFWLCTFVAEI